MLGMKQGRIFVPPHYVLDPDMNKTEGLRDTLHPNITLPG